MSLLSIENLTVEFPVEGGVVTAVDDLSLSVGEGETLAIVGESGSGKSVTALSVMRLVEHGGGRIRSGAIRFRTRGGAERDLAREAPERLERLRGDEIAMIFQEPMTSLNPVFTVGDQIAEAVTLHQGLGRREARAEALRMLERVRIPAPKSLIDRYPHQLSGGMRQRVMIAMALSCRPRLLIADEPTTALDVTIQAQILRLVRTLQQEMGMGVVFITHDMGVVAEIADRVAVMWRGAKVEEGATEDIFEHPSHPYTRALLAAVPRLGSLAGTDLPARFPLPSETVADAAMHDTVHLEAAPVLDVEGLTTRFDVRRGIFGRLAARVHAVERISFALRPGETLALVGESGCGKSTTGRSIMRLVERSGGSIRFRGEDAAGDGEAEQRLRQGVAYVFQDPYASLNPRLTVGFSVAEPILTHKLASGREVDARVAELLTQVGLEPAHARRYPHEFSGGQRQRIAIARALASAPDIIIADEAVSALDVSIRAQIVNLLMELQERSGVAYLFISHDMAVVERVSHRVAVMYLGQIVEIGPRRAVFENPLHPYTRRLMEAVPVPDPRRRRRAVALDDSEVPSPIRPLGDEPTVAPLVEVAPGHFVAQHSVGGLF